MYELIQDAIRIIAHFVQHDILEGLLNSVVGKKTLPVMSGLLLALSGIKQFYSFQKKKRIEKDLHPDYTPEDIRTHTQYYVPQKFQNAPPHDEEDLDRTFAVAARGKLIPHFLKEFNSGHQIFFFILADTGMGKTAFMINLYMNYVNQWISRKYKIRLYPLFKLDENKIKALPDKENTILLLDAFDEDNQAATNYNKRLEEITNLTGSFRKVILTCRTQFFPSDLEIPHKINVRTEKGYQIFHKLYISPFDETDIQSYLNKKYGVFRFWNYKTKHKARQIIEHAPKLVVRPMLLTFMDELVKSNRHYHYSYQIYEELIKRWILREVERKSPDEQVVRNSEEQLYKFSSAIALYIFKRFKESNELFIKEEEIALFAKKYDIRLSEIEMKSQSLLNRTANREYKFSHKSILEYFLAVEAFKDKEFGKEIISERNQGMIQARKFYKELLAEEFINKN